MDIICLSSIDWDFNWQGHQQIMSTLAAQGHRVLFVENTGVRSPLPRDVPRLARRLRNRLRGSGGFRSERENLCVYAPVILPFPYSRAARSINRALVVSALRRWMRRQGFERPVFWTFLPTALALDLAARLQPALTVYYCVDDLGSSSPKARRIRESEVRMLREADLVFVTSEKLRARALQFRGEAHLLPFGVDFERFEDAREGATVPADLDALSRPRVGYVGGLHRWVDQDLVVAVAGAMPEVRFVFVGPLQADVSRLETAPNVRLLGAKPHSDVARYIKGFDVGLVPYVLSEYTSHVYPTKLNEYLAMGIPIVATDLPEIRAFNERHGPVVAVARDAEAFRRAIREALPGLEARERLRRIEIARTNAWKPRIARMEALIEGGLS